MSTPDDLDQLVTESARGGEVGLDHLPVEELVALMCSDLQRVHDALAEATPAIARVVQAVSAHWAKGGRLFYVGAGTAGRLGVLDASELGPTFDVAEGQVVAVLAGGSGAFSSALEGAEDDAQAGGQAMADHGVGSGDVVVGISASGRTPFVLGAIEAANAAAALTVGVACNRGSPLAGLANIPIEIPVGPEILSGSTRLNAGTAQKVVLNIISTATMVRLGKTYGNLMIDVRATNAKLRHRAIRIVTEITGVEEAEAASALAQAGWKAKVAVVMLTRRTGAEEATRLLDEAGGRLQALLPSS